MPGSGTPTFRWSARPASCGTDGAVAMRFIDRLSLKLKLSLASAACLAMLALTAAVALWGFDHLASTLQRLTGERLPSYTFSARLDSDLRDMNALMNESIALAAVGYG